MKKEKIVFKAENIKLLTLLEKTNKNIFLIGKGGAGKSFNINYFISKTKKKFVLLGTTGVAAINIGGQTIHKFFGIIPGKTTSRMKSETFDIIRNTDIFIIDEWGMARADLFDQINVIMQKVMKNDKFMGGKQFAFVGDLYQLPAIPERDEELKKYFDEKYKGVFFFNALCYKKENIETIELINVHRQKDMKLINMLNRLRIGDSSQDLLDYFNKRVVKESEVSHHAILIATTNKIVNNKNFLELSKIPGDKFISTAFIDGDYPDNIYPTDRVITIKKGCRIMFTVNHKNGDYVNGTLGTILDISTNMKGFVNIVKIQTDDGDILEISKYKWINSPGEDEFGEAIIDGTFTQLPFKLAFSITVHKVQGKSFDNVVIDLGYGAFSAGQTYVALSRARSYEGIQLLEPIRRKDIIVDKDVINFLKK